MAALNPMQLILMLKNGNPQAVAEQIIQQNFANDPQMQNLLQMAQRGDSQGLEKIAQTMLNAQGKNFGAEMNNLMQMLRNV